MSARPGYTYRGARKRQYRERRMVWRNGRRWSRSFPHGWHAALVPTWLPKAERP